jgi:pyruvate-ferredoxin/flavodoxin oxidoreductase
VPVHEYVALPPAAREGKVPYVLSTDSKARLIKLEVDTPIVHLVEERRKYWRTLQHLAGLPVQQSEVEHRAVLAEMQSRYQEAMRDREGSLDQIAKAMSELAASSNAPAASGFGGTMFAPAPAAAPAAAAAAKPNGQAGAIVTLAEADMAKCTNCKTCYQDLSELFEKTKIVVNGQTKDVARLIPGALEHTTVTPELKARIAKVSANCDAEIIH